MENVNGEKQNNFYHILSKNYFSSTATIPDVLKCGKCENILANAYQVKCGCNFCKNCIDGMQFGGMETCPGQTDLCKSVTLSDKFQNIKINNQVLKLVIKCPRNDCLYECELKDMEEHWLYCPFSSFGCADDKLMIDKRDEVLQSDRNNHHNILIDMIGDLKNEVNLLKESHQRSKINLEISRDKLIIAMNEEIKRNKNRIDQLMKEDFKMKDETIAEMQNEIRSIKMEKQQMAQQIEALKVQLGSQTKQMAVQMHGKCCDDQIESIKMGTRELARQIKILEKKVDKKKPDKSPQKKQDSCEKLKNDDIEKYEMITRIEQVEKWLDKQIDGTFVWKIDKISAIIKNETGISSACFYPRKNAYKMQLLLGNDANSDELLIRLFIQPGEIDDYLTWPFDENVTIKIVNKASRGVCRMVTNHCIIAKPTTKACELSDMFVFNFSDLSSAGLVQEDCIIIECFVDV